MVQNNNPKNGTNEKVGEVEIQYYDEAPTENNRKYEEYQAFWLDILLVGCHNWEEGNCLATVDVDKLQAQQPSIATAVNHAITSVSSGNSTDIVDTFDDYETELNSVFGSSLVTGVINETVFVHSEDFPIGAIGEFIIDGDTISIDSSEVAENYVTFYFSDNSGVIAEAPIALDE